MNNIENHAKIWINNNWVNFKIKSGVYTNIITFLDNNTLSFIKKNHIDFDKIPIPIHGNGNSQNLLDYLSNNNNNPDLIQSFLSYFINKLDFRYIDDTKIKIKIINNIDWRKSIVIVDPKNNKSITADTTIPTADM